VGLVIIVDIWYMTSAARRAIAETVIVLPDYGDKASGSCLGSFPLMVEFSVQPFHVSGGLGLRKKFVTRCNIFLDGRVSYLEGFSP
jgi:hypothetical protein